MATNIVGPAPKSLPTLVEQIDRHLEKFERHMRGAVRHYVEAGVILFSGFTPTDDYYQAQYFADVQRQATAKQLPGRRWSESTLKRLFRWGEACVKGGLKERLLGCAAIAEGDKLLAPVRPQGERKGKSPSESDPRIEKATEQFRERIAKAGEGTTDEGVHSHEPTHPETHQCSNCEKLRKEIEELKSVIARRDHDLAALREHIARKSRPKRKTAKAATAVRTPAGEALPVTAPSGPPPKGSTIEEFTEFVESYGGRMNAKDDIDAVAAIPNTPGTAPKTPRKRNGQSKIGRDEE